MQDNILNTVALIIYSHSFSLKFYHAYHFWNMNMHLYTLCILYIYKNINMYINKILT